MKRQKTQNSQHDTEERSWRTDIFNFKTNCKATVIKTEWYWQNTRQVGQWDRIQNPGKYLHNYSQLISGKGTKAI